MRESNTYLMGLILWLGFDPVLVHYDRAARDVRSGRSMWTEARKIKYFADTDTLYIEFRGGTVVETRDLDENTLLDVDATGNICAITVEHASERTGSPEFSYEQISA